MKKLCLMLALLLLLSGCGRNEPSAQKPQPPVATAGNDHPSEIQMVSFDIYAINDLHGRFADTDEQPGLDELSTYLKQARENGNTIVLSTGDMWQGTAESSFTNGLMITEWMNRLDFTAMTLGGHEFDWGEACIRKNRELAEFPFLAINVYSRETDAQADYCQSSVVVEFDGVRIGIIGAIGDCSSSVSAENIKNVYFKTGDELTALVKAEAEKLRSEGADFIIYAIHDGSTKTSDGMNAIAVKDEEIEQYYDVALSEGYVDLVFEADTHYSYVLVDRQGVYHLQAGGNNSGLSHARVLIDKTHKEHHILTAELLSNSKYSFMEDDPVVNELLEKYEEQLAPAFQIMGHNSQYRTGRNICQLVAQLYCDTGVKEWGAEYDIVLGGGYISCRSPGYMPAGEVTYSQLFSLLPFDNQITLCSIRGSDLISKFLETDNDAYHIKTTAYGEAVRESIDPDETYYVITDTYSAEYAYNNMTVIDTYSESIFARDLLAAYITAGGLE